MKRYFPPREDWERRAPADAGFDEVRLATAIEYACENEIDWPIDAGKMVGRNDTPPYNEMLGPTKPRGAANGLVIRRGYLIAEWGEPARVDMTFSATKSYVSTLVGLAKDRGMLGSMDELVRERIADGGFDSDHNSTITWRHLLQQTSEWQGKLFDRPDVVDHNRSLVEADGNEMKGVERELQPPGSFWEYNDVRVNRAALCALRIWGEPLPEVLRREVMDPIGASDEWEWHGYRNSWVDVDGEQMQSVSGGAHWGGGLWISALDHGRFGYLILAGGEWDGRRLLSKDWIDEATTPCDANDQYGYMWWLNTGQQLYEAPSSSFAAQGAGGNVVFIDREDDLVVVTRWSGDRVGVVNRIVAALL
jgi:CubicO group peptidase (beta-lactamase class C family)